MGLMKHAQIEVDNKIRELWFAFLAGRSMDRYIRASDFTYDLFKQFIKRYHNDLLDSVDRVKLNEYLQENAEVG